MLVDHLNNAVQILIELREIHSELDQVFFILFFDLVTSHVLLIIEFIIWFFPRLESLGHLGLSQSVGAVELRILAQTY